MTSRTHIVKVDNIILQLSGTNLDNFIYCIAKSTQRAPRKSSFLRLDYFTLFDFFQVTYLFVWENIKKLLAFGSGFTLTLDLISDIRLGRAPAFACASSSSYSTASSSSTSPASSSEGEKNLRWLSDFLFQDYIFLGDMVCSL